jgi:hypothetical protein
MSFNGLRRETDEETNLHSAEAGAWEKSAATNVKA